MEILKGVVEWSEVLRVIDYDFESLGASSAVDIQHPEYGELSFLWSGNKSNIHVTFVNSSYNCICPPYETEAETIVSCDCDWIGFKSVTWETKTFTKAQYQRLVEPDLFI